MAVGDGAGSGEVWTIQAALEQLFFARWRQPVYRGPGTEPGWYCFTAVNCKGQRELVEVRPDRGEVRVTGSGPEPHPHGGPPNTGALRPCALEGAA